MAEAAKMNSFFIAKGKSNEAIGVCISGFWGIFKSRVCHLRMSWCVFIDCSGIVEISTSLISCFVVMTNISSLL